MDEVGGFGCLGHSYWTICIPLSPFCSGNFQFVSPLYWEANSYYPRGLIVRKGRFSNSKSEWDRGVWVPGAFKLDHLHPFKPILFWKFSICFIFILGGHFLLPQRANSEKGEKSNSRNGWDLGFWVPGAFKLDHLHHFKPIWFLEFSICFTFILGDHFLLPQRANTEKREICQFQKWMRQRGLGAWDIQTGVLAPL